MSDQQQSFSFPKSDSLIQLAVGFVRQIPEEKLQEAVTKIRTEILDRPRSHQELLIKKVLVAESLLNLRRALQELDRGMGFDPFRYEVLD